jgi:hypothetical protein
MGQYEAAILAAFNKVTHFNDMFVGVIDEAHESIHDGRFFTLSVPFTKNNGENADLIFTFPNDLDKEYHFDAVFSSTGAGGVTLYRTPTLGSGGTDKTFTNNNELSSNVSDVTAKSDQTISGVGTLMEQVRVGSSGSGVNALGGGNGNTREEWITRNKTYLLRYVSLTNSNNITLTIHYYFKPV